MGCCWGCVGACLSWIWAALSPASVAVAVEHSHYRELEPGRAPEGGR